MKWPQNITDKLKKCVDADLTAGQTAARLRMSRGKVIGKARRMGWTFGRPGYEKEQEEKIGVVRGPKNYTRRSMENVISITTEFDSDTVLKIVEVGNQYQVTRNEAIRMLVEWGIESCQ